MKYEKAMVEVIAFDKNREFLGWVPSGSNNNDQDAARREGEARARSLMGWNSPNRL